MPGIEHQPPTDEEVVKIRKAFEEYISKNGNEAFYEEDVERVRTDDFYVHRWFMHVHDKKGDQLEDCVENMITALKWRKTEKVREITADNLNPQFKEKGDIYMKGEDKDGCPLLVFAMARHVKGDKPDEMKRLFLYYLDRIDRETKDGMLSLVFECVGCGVTNMDMEIIAFMIKMLDDYYPDNLKYILIIDMGWLLTACWKIIKGWIPPAGVRKVKFLSKNTLSEFIPEDHQLRIWGGENDWAYEFIEENVTS